jgi:hypothetical protein
MEPLDTLATAVADTAKKLDLGPATVRIDDEHKVVVVEDIPGIGASRVLEAALRQVRLEVEVDAAPGTAYFRVLVHPS